MNIVILGGSYAGISTAHRILKQAAKTEPFKITLVCPNTHLYWNMASPRGAIPGQLTDEELFRPIAPGFDQYPASQFELIQATAERVDVDDKKVHVDSSSGIRALDYDLLILATGSHTKEGTPFKMLSSTEATKVALHDFQARVKKAKKIVVAGAGLTGVEFVGELAFEYGRGKEIILLASGPTVLEGMPASVSSLAMKKLQMLEVEVKLRAKVERSDILPHNEGEITLSDGSKLTADMYVPAFGLIPNSSYMPARFLSTSGHVIVDDYLRVKGTEAVWAIGDISDKEPAQFKVTDAQSSHLSKNIVRILSNKELLPYQTATPFRGVSIGKKAGTGHFGPTKIPSFVIVMARRNLFLGNMDPTIDGSLF